MMKKCDRRCFNNGFWSAIIFIIGGIVFIALYETWVRSEIMFFNNVPGMLDIITGLGTAVIAFFAYLQYKTYRFSLNNELFDKRSKIHEGIRQLFLSIIDKEKFTLDDRFNYIESIKGYNFIFKEDMQKYIKLVLQKAALYRMYHVRGNCVEKQKIYNWFVEENESLDDKFKEYLGIYQ